MKTNQFRALAVLCKLGVLGVAVTLPACDSTRYLDYLSATATVFAVDGKTPVQGLAITDYNWIVNYKDGSTVAMPFKPAVSTDAAGQFSFTSAELALRSGHLVEECTPVCVDWSTSYETVCDSWGYDEGYEYCTDWGYDEYGYEQCYAWEWTGGESYCTSSHEEAYDYCSFWGEDCEYYYPTRVIGDIKAAYSEITYVAGSSRVTTQSAGTTLAADAVVSQELEQDGDTIIDATWNQRDTFTTPLLFTGTGAASKAGGSKAAAEAVALTPRQQEIFAARNAGRRVGLKAPRPSVFGRNHPPAGKAPFAQLSKARQAKVEAARAACGAVRTAK